MDTVTYEQPLNDPMRICFRLESLFSKLQHHIASTHQIDHQIAMQSLLEVMNVLERPDLKSKLTQALTQHSNHLHSMVNSPEVNRTALKQYIEQLNELTSALQNQQRIAANLRQNSFLSAMRGHLAKPGGLCHFHHPAYQLWLQQAASDRSEQLNNWFSSYNLIESITRILLQLSRYLRPCNTVSCTDGFFQQNLNPSHAWQMLQVILPSDQFIYPEISIGKHRVCIRLLEPENLSDSGHGSLVKNHLSFKLRCCYL